MNWIAYFLTVIGLIFLTKKKIIAWPILISSNIFYFIHYYKLQDFAALFLFTTYFIINIIGWREWSNEKK